MDIYLIRHGESQKADQSNYDTQKQTANPKLSENGINQAEILSNHCKNIKFDIIYSSDLHRAVQTAKILRKNQNCEHIVDSNIREIDMGEIYKKPWSNFPEEFEQWKKHEQDLCYPKGENGAMVYARCKKTIGEIINSDHKSVAIICHGGTIGCIICGLLNIPSKKGLCLANRYKTAL